MFWHFTGIDRSCIWWLETSSAFSDVRLSYRCCLASGDREMDFFKNKWIRNFLLGFVHFRLFGICSVVTYSLLSDLGF